MTVSRTTLVGIALVIFAATVWLYWPSVHGEFLHRMDDDEYLRQSVRLHGLTWNAVKWAFSTTEPYYHPLPRLSHVIDYQIWGKNAGGHHATSVVLHAINAALVFGFLWTLLGATDLTTRERLTVALCVAVVFAIHPLQVESVAWMSGRTQLLCAAFGIGSLWAYVAGARRWLVWGLFVAALLSKPMAVSLPFVMLGIDYFPLRRHERFGWGRLLREKSVLIGLGAVTAVAAMITESQGAGLMIPFEKISLSQRVLLMFESLTFYPWKLVWPVGLLPYYPLRLGMSLGQSLALASALFVGIVTVLSFRHRRRTPALAVTWGAYVLFILPVSGLAQAGGQAVANRYAYVAMLALLLLASAVTIWLWRRCATAGRLALAFMLLCEVCSFGLCTRSQIPVWRDDETLWRVVLVQFPNARVANQLLAEALLRQNRIPEALEYGQRAVRVDPDFAETQNNLGVALFLTGKFEEAVAHFEQALRNQPDSVDYAEVHYNLGLALARLGRRQEAVEHYEQALRSQPDYAEAHNDLGNVLLQEGRVNDAIGHFEQALRSQPEYAEAHNNLGIALFQTGKRDEAMEQFELALRIEPDFAAAHYDLGTALEKAGRVSEAIHHFEEALRLQPDLTAARTALARLQAHQ